MLYFSDLVRKAKCGLQLAHLLTSAIGISALDFPFDVVHLMHQWHEPIFIIYAAITMIDYINACLTGRRK